MPPVSIIVPVVGLGRLVHRGGSSRGDPICLVLIHTWIINRLTYFSLDLVKDELKDDKTEGSARFPILSPKRGQLYITAGKFRAP